jgi:flavin-binding protein dodecin
MSIARVTELSATSETSFEDAINVAVATCRRQISGYGHQVGYLI